MSPPPKLSRRTMTVGGAVAIGAAIVAGGIFELPRLIKHRARGHYADLVNLLDDPEQAAIIGRTIHLDRPDGSAPSLVETSSSIRAALKGRTLPQLLARDAGSAELTEADGWVLPATLASLCSMAAQST